MKKLIALLLSLVCVLGLCACNSKKDIPFDDTGVFFVGKVIEVYDSYLLVEVTDKGNTSFSIGARLEVSTNVSSADGCSNFVAEEYAKILYDGKVATENPPGRLEAYSIYKTDENGMNIKDLDKEILPLEKVKECSQEKLNKQLIGILRADLLNVWGEPDGHLSGFWGDTWQLGNEKGEHIIVYYDQNGIIENVKVADLSE